MMIDLIKTRDAARLMGVSKPTFYRWRKTDPQFPRIYREQGFAWVTREDLEAYVELRFQRMKGEKQQC